MNPFVILIGLGVAAWILMRRQTTGGLSVPPASTTAPSSSSAPSADNPPTTSSTPGVVYTTLNLTQDDWRFIQNGLNALGYGNLVVDGIPGPQTQAAVKSFQFANSLAVDGIVGPDTWNTLHAAVLNAQPAA